MAKFSKDNQPDKGGCGDAIAKSNKSRQILSDQYRLAMNRLTDQMGEDGKPMKVATVMAKKIAELAMGGDIAAAKEIADRTEGKAPQSIELGGPNGGPVQVTIGSKDADTL